MGRGRRERGTWKGRPRQRYDSRETSNVLSPKGRKRCTRERYQAREGLCRGCSQCGAVDEVLERERDGHDEDATTANEESQLGRSLRGLVAFDRDGSGKVRGKTELLNGEMIASTTGPGAHVQQTVALNVAQAFSPLNVACLQFRLVLCCPSSLLCSGGCTIEGSAAGRCDASSAEHRQGKERTRKTGQKKTRAAEMYASHCSVPTA
mmetsp:Transcript_53238/g.124756  ORF Transcript_53238/g.124756 Transcript_53238/m.124756 type:complete len:207 (-) Transcript_53238:73-693(-)